MQVIKRQPQRWTDLRPPSIWWAQRGRRVANCVSCCCRCWKFLCWQSEMGCLLLSNFSSTFRHELMITSKQHQSTTATNKFTFSLQNNLFKMNKFTFHYSIILFKNCIVHQAFKYSWFSYEKQNKFCIFCWHLFEPIKGLLDMLDKTT